MSLIELKDLSKIYSKDGALTVGIQNVNLEFDAGEFVAITGESGSGKTTLLNVIGGIDTYEEGDLYINGENTSYYTSNEWEDFRRKYISYVFQDYKIIDDFTVLENIELVLSDIEHKKERKRIAHQVIEKVGLGEYINKKAGHLSGGQKQRVSIARAIAKDSKILLADEPTGNIDAEASHEIIKLLYELSTDKLVLIVTHDIEEVRNYITREVCISDGDIKYDTIIKSESGRDDISLENKISTKRDRSYLDGLSLGWKLFRSMPKLTSYLCFLLVLASLSVFSFTSLIGMLIKSEYHIENNIFSEYENRLIVMNKDGKPISADEANELGQKSGATSFLHCDLLYDAFSERQWIEFVKEPGNYISQNDDIPFNIIQGTSNDSLDVGRFPETVSECMLSIPYSLSDYYGEDSILIPTIIANEIEYKIVGIDYYTDNNIVGRIILTPEGHKINSAIAYIGKYLSGTIQSEYQNSSDEEMIYLSYSFDVKPDKIYIKKSNTTDKNSEYKVELVKCKDSQNIIHSFDKGVELFMVVDKQSVVYDEAISKKQSAIVVNPYMIMNDLEQYIDRNYAQCSLFFENNEKMNEAVSILNNAGCISIESNSYFTPDKDISMNLIFGAIIAIVIWVVVTYFLMLFVSLGAKRTMELITKNISIMRFIGVKKKTIDIALRARMILSMLPAVLVTLIFAFVIYRIPLGNRLFLYLYPTHYVLIFLVITVINLFSAKKQINLSIPTITKSS